MVRKLHYLAWRSLYFLIGLFQISSLATQGQRDSLHFKSFCHSHPLGPYVSYWGHAWNINKIDRIFCFFFFKSILFILGTIHKYAFIVFLLSGKFCKLIILFDFYTNNLAITVYYLQNINSYRIFLLPLLLIMLSFQPKKPLFLYWNTIFVSVVHYCA